MISLMYNIDIERRRKGSFRRARTCGSKILNYVSINSFTHTRTYELVRGFEVSTKSQRWKSRANDITPV